MRFKYRTEEEWADLVGKLNDAERLEIASACRRHAEERRQDAALVARGDREDSQRIAGDIQQIAVDLDAFALRVDL